MLVVSGAIDAVGSPTNMITFAKPPASQAGGYVWLTGGTNSYTLKTTGVFDYCAFTGLSNELGYSAVLLVSNADLTVDHCSFTNLPGTGVRGYYSRMTIVNSTFSRVGYGVGGHNAAGLVGTNSMSQLLNDCIDMKGWWDGPGDTAMVVDHNNLCNSAAAGCDGIDFDGGRLVIRYNTITNTTKTGINIGESCLGEIHNNLVIGCPIAAQIRDSAAPVLMNETYINCFLGIRSAEGRLLSGGRGIVMNSIIWNSATNISVEATSFLGVTNCNTVGGPLWPGAGNMTADPLFVNAAQGDYRLQTSSPCVNAGTNQVWMAGAVDRDGAPRIQWSVVDIGAYESAWPGWTGPGPAPFMAYNDFGATQVVDRITTNSAFGLTNGPLINWTSGAALAARIGVTPVATVAGFYPQGSNAVAGSDADQIFGGKMDCMGYMFWQTGSVMVTVSGLDPAGRYDVVLFGNKANASYTDRWTDVTISDVTSFTNRSSTGSIVSNDRTRIVTGWNPAGLIHRFDQIDPGADGDIQLTLAGSGLSSTYMNAFMLRTATPPALSAWDDWTVQYFGTNRVSLAADADDDGANNQAEYLAGTNPTNPADRFIVTGLRPAPTTGGVVVTWNTVTGRFYSVSTVTNLDLSWSDLSAPYTNMPGTGEALSYTNHDGTDSLFLRVRVRKP